MRAMPRADPVQIEELFDTALVLVECRHYDGNDRNLKGFGYTNHGYP